MAGLGQNPAGMQNLSAFGKIIESMVPGAGAVAIYRRDGRTLWANGGPALPELQAMASDVLAARGGPAPIAPANLTRDRQVFYAFPIRAERDAPLGVLAVTVERPSGSSEPDTADTLSRHLAPVLAVLLRELTHQDEQHLRVARVDAATGLPTLTALEDHVASYRASGGSVWGVVYIDIDQMHVINDLFGFHTGDEILQRVADLWPEGTLGNGGLIARVAGDRFVAVLDCPTLGQARAWADAVRTSLGELDLPEVCKGFRLSASFGVAMLEESARFETALTNAETACRAAKDRGRRRIELFTVDDLSLVRRREDLQIFREVVSSLEQGRIELLTQPIVPLAPSQPQRPTQYEVLVRLCDSTGAMLEPRRFLSAARRYQLLPQLDKRVIERVCHDLAPLAGQLDALGTRFWINVSGPSVSQADFADQTCALIKASGLPGELVGFEITESAAIENLPAAQRFIARLSALGCSFALDDFGTGFSSLAYLQALAVRTIKIDGGFVREVLEDHKAEAMIRTVLDVAGQLGLETVAECITNRDIASRLAELGVTYGQGFHFSAPHSLRALLDSVQTSPASRVFA